MLYRGPGKVSRPMNGRDYGALWADRFPLAIVLHTTETAVMPGYNGGAYAPHITINVKTREVTQHVRLDRRTGTLRGSSQVLKDTGVRTVINEKAVQAEIIGYSDRAVVYQYGGNRVWVGDFTDDDYNFLAEVVAYLKEVHGIGDDIHARPSGSSWSYGINSPHRLGAREWEALNGITAHGGVFGQTHWDTGVLDLHRIWTPAPKPEPKPEPKPQPKPQPKPTPTPEVDTVMTKLPTLRLNDGFKAGRPERKPHVQRLQAILAIEGFVAANTFKNHTPDGLFGNGTLTAVRNFQKARKLTVDGIVGEKTWQALMRV